MTRFFRIFQIKIHKVNQDLYFYFVGKSKTKKKDAKVEKEAEKAATPEAKEIEAATGTPQAASSSSSKPEPEQPIEVVDGNCVSSKIEQNHVEQNHVGNNKEVEKKVEETVEEVIKTNDDNVAVTDEMTTNDINTEGDEVVLENGTASSSANNSNPASKSSSLIKLKYNYPDGKSPQKNSTLAKNIYFLNFWYF